MTATRKLAEPWDVEKAANPAAEVLRYLARYYPECAGSDALRAHEDAAPEAAMDADEDRYREALRSYCRGGRGDANTKERGVRRTFTNRDALDQQLLQRFGGKVGEFSSRLEFW